MYLCILFMTSSRALPKCLKRGLNITHSLLNCYFFSGSNSLMIDETTASKTPTKNRKSTTVVGLNTITCPYLLYTALKATLHVGQSGYFVEVAMSSDEEIERQSELSEGALGRAQYDWLVVDLQSPTSTLPRETNCVPRIQRHLPNASVLTDIRTRSHHSSTSFSSSSLSSIHQHQ